MPRYRVYFETIANLTVEVEVEVEAENEADAYEAGSERIENEIGNQVCAMCSGYSKRYSLDLGEWEHEHDHSGQGGRFGVETPPVLIEGS